MASSQRTPRDLREMVSGSKQDMQEMQDNLSKLRSLKEDDKTENGMLRSRIDEQSQLIMILKQRADEEIVRAQTLERINKELTEFREHADDMLKSEVRKFSQLETRFYSLASNHEEMIKIKDEYKRVNKELREENARLKSENARMFSKALQDKDARIQELEKKFAIMKQESTNMDAKFRQMQQEWRHREDDLKQQLQQMTESSAAQIKDLQHRAQQAEERLKGANHKLQNQTDSRLNAEQELNAKLNIITKEKDELLDLAMQRGKLIQNFDSRLNAEQKLSAKLGSVIKEKDELLNLAMQRGQLIQKEQTENKKLVKKIEDVENLMKAMQAKFDRDAAAVNANLQVQKLKEELAESAARSADVEKEFSAYKKHSSNLLKQEKELNERLRHLVG